MDIKNQITSGKLEYQSNLIYHYLKMTTEPFDNWEWDGENLVIFLEDEIIEQYNVEDLTDMIEGF